MEELFKSKDRVFVYVWFTIMGTISLFAMSDASTVWKIITPVFLYGVAVGTFVYELSKK